MTEIVIEQHPLLRAEARELEYVERKGLGHPDSICDAVMDAISLELSRVYLEVAGRVLHHNTDKGLLSAGQTTPRLGGGTVEQPMRLIVGDRATMAFNGRRLALDELVENAAFRWFRENLRWVDPARHVVLQNELRPGSAELSGLFDQSSSGWRANDTSVAVGFAPLSETERLVLAAEHMLNSSDFKHRFPETGEDVKVMGVRRGRRLQLTVAVAFVDHLLWEEATYFHRKEAVARELTEFLQTKLHTLDGVEARVNALDAPGRGVGGMYLTVLGTSAESADGGEVGRGNRVNGLISACRPMTLEAAAGKNPVSHVGKIYNLLAQELARAIHGQLEPVEEVQVWLCSRIGAPLDEPWACSVQLSLADGAAPDDLADEIRDITHEHLRQIETFTGRIIAGEFPVC